MNDILKKIDKMIEDADCREHLRDIQKYIRSVKTPALTSHVSAPDLATQIVNALRKEDYGETWNNVECECIIVPRVADEVNKYLNTLEEVNAHEKPKGAVRAHSQKGTKHRKH